MKRMHAAVVAVLLSLSLWAGASAARASYMSTVLADNPVGYWRLDEAAAGTAVNIGSAGALLNGTHVNFAGTGAGLVNDGNLAGSFNGVQSAAGTHITGGGLNSVGGGNPFAGNWTIEGWFVRDTVNAWSGVFSDNNGAFPGPLMTFIDTTNQLGINGTGITANNVSVDLGAGSLGKRVYAVITKTGGNADSTANLTVYANVDGQWLTPATGTNSGWTLTANDGFYIGRHYSGAAQMHDGLIDEVAIYNQALTTAQINTHFAASGNTPAVMPAMIIDAGNAGYSEIGGWASAGGLGTVNDDYHYAATGAGVSATWTPANVLGFTPGEEYFVQVDWGVFNTHTDMARFTVNAVGGPSATVVDMRDDGSQGSANGLPAPANGRSSGWVTLGRFTLDNLSSIVLDNLAGATGFLSADAVRISKVYGGEGYIVDEVSGAAVFSGSAWSGVAPVIGNDPESLDYRHTNGTAPAAQVQYTLGWDGLADVFLSWGAYGSTHTTMAQYLIDLDGNLLTLGDQTTLLINQQQLADQSTLAGLGGGEWSGWYYAGQFQLTPNSIVVLTDVATGGTHYLTADALRVTPIYQAPPVPEPATIGLTALAGIALIARRRRSARA